MELDKNILDALEENSNPENSTHYRLKIDENLTLVNIDEKTEQIPSRRFLGKPPIDFGINMYHPSKRVTNLATSVDFYSYQDTYEINNKQIGRLFFILNKLLKNSIDSGLKGEITQSMELSRKEKNLVIGPINTVYKVKLPQVHGRLPQFTGYLDECFAKTFRVYRDCEATYNFEDGIANAIRGDVVDERLGYMDSEGEFGGLEPEKDSKTLDDYFVRDLKLKEILGNIKFGI